MHLKKPNWEAARSCVHDADNLDRVIMCKMNQNVMDIIAYRHLVCWRKTSQNYVFTNVANLLLFLSLLAKTGEK